MKRLKLNEYSYLVTVWLFLVVRGEAGTYKNNAKFPKDFCFGAGSAAYQIEGAWNADGKGESIWDNMVHTDPNSIIDKSNGDVSSNSYYFYKRDVAILKELGVQVYRFSISWSRILANGKTDVNPLGIQYYNNLINELLRNKIQPFVTIYHFDLPQALSEEGGWMNEDITNWFENYAATLFENFGDRVKYWLTINEPYIHCMLAYEQGIHPPRIRKPGVGVYECIRNMILASAKAYGIYERRFKHQGGKVGLSISSEWADPATGSEEDVQAAKDYILFTFDLIMHPIFSKNGNYPAKVINRVASKSIEQGLSTSRLRPFTPKEIDLIRGSADFLGLNHYSTVKIYGNDSRLDASSTPSFQNDAGIGIKVPDDNLPTAQNSLYDESPGMYSLLLYIQKNYNIPIYITENGYSSKAGLEDDRRVNYIKNYLNATLRAIGDGANVKGYFVWSLKDSFEWTAGYEVKYGLYEVDFNDPNKTRTPRKSAIAYKKIVKTRTIDADPGLDRIRQTFLYANNIGDSALQFIKKMLHIIFSKTEQ